MPRKILSKCARRGSAGETLDQELILVVQHEPKPLPGNVAGRLPVDGVTERHVISRDGLGDRARRTAGLKEDARDFLPGSDLRKRAVTRLIEVDREGLAVGSKEFFLLAHGGRI